jgi:hypothetical protein
MPKSIVLAVELMVVAFLAAAPCAAGSQADAVPGEGSAYWQLASNGHNCGSLTPENQRRALADELTKIFARRWKAIGPVGFADRTASGLRTQILHSNYRYIQYPRNVAVWIQRRDCFDGCFERYRKEKAQSAGSAESALEDCIRTCISRHQYYDCR